MNEKVSALLKDEGFVSEALKLTTAEDAQKLFASKGADISVEEIKSLYTRYKQTAGAALNDDELELVAGGSSKLSKECPKCGTIMGYFSYGDGYTEWVCGSCKHVIGPKG